MVNMIIKSKRLLAFLIHFCISLFVALCVAAVVYFVWYPQPLAKAMGVTNIFLIMLVIDVVLGSVLTLIVYKEGKKSLKFDLSVIVVIQLLALIYGVFVIMQGRPVWIVFNADRFDAISYQEIDNRNIHKAKPIYQKPSLGSPKFVAAIMPVGVDERNDVVLESVFAGIDIAYRPNLYVPLFQEKINMQKRRLPLSELKKHNIHQAVEKIIFKYPQATHYLPLKANTVDMTVLLDKNGDVVKIVDLRPW